MRKLVKTGIASVVASMLWMLAGHADDCGDSVVGRQTLTSSENPPNVSSAVSNLSVRFRVVRSKLARMTNPKDIIDLAASPALPRHWYWAGVPCGTNTAAAEISDMNKWEEDWFIRGRNAMIERELAKRGPAVRQFLLVNAEEEERERLAHPCELTTSRGCLYCGPTQGWVGINAVCANLLKRLDLLDAGGEPEESSWDWLIWRHWAVPGLEETICEYDGPDTSSNSPSFSGGSFGITSRQTTNEVPTAPPISTTSE